MNTMERTAVKSREIAIVGYDPEGETLEIVFRRGGVYHYFGVPQKTHQDLMSSSSQGTFFSENIKPKYPYQKIN